MAEGAGNRGRSTEFRNDVLLYLHEQGFAHARRAPEIHGASPAEREAADIGDILGVPWTLRVRRQESLNLGRLMNETARQAANSGNPLYAGVQYRRTHDVSDAYVTMPLRVFVQAMILTSHGSADR